MKIGLNTNTLDLGYGRFGKEAFKKIREHGFDAIDFQMMDTDATPYNIKKEEADVLLKEIKELSEDAGVEIAQVHGPWRWPILDDTEENRRERMEKMKESLRMTAVIGCKKWVIHPIMPFGIEDILMKKEAETWDINLGFMRELLDTAKKYDITICLENMPFINFSLSKPEKILEFVKAIDDENFKICLDTGHVNVFPDLSVADEVRRLRENIKAFHIHDNKFGEDLHLFPYFGTIDWEDFKKALGEIGYDGVFSLETGAPGRLSAELFEEMSASLFKIAKEIAEGIDM